MKHTHGHRHRVPHPDAFGRSTWVAHEHEHNHSSSLDIARTEETDHRPHGHTVAEKADLRKQQLR